MYCASMFKEVGKKIVCVGRNYRNHAKELGNQVPEKPILFLKPTSAYVSEGQPIRIPKGCTCMHHEVELGVVIDRAGSKITEASAMNYVGGYILALDMTARDFQEQAKKKGQPWTLAKGFDTSCPVSEFIPRHRLNDPHNLRLWLEVNGCMKQNGKTMDMIFRIPYLISYISEYMTLEVGDVILTGTPEGVGEANPGDTITCGLEDLDSDTGAPVVLNMKFDVAHSHFEKPAPIKCD